MANTELAWRVPASVQNKLADGTWLLTGATGFLGERAAAAPPRQQGLQLRRRRRRLPPRRRHNVPPIRQLPACAALALALVMRPQTGLPWVPALAPAPALPLPPATSPARCCTTLAHHGPTQAYPITASLCLPSSPPAGSTIIEQLLRNASHASWCVLALLAQAERPMLPLGPPGGHSTPSSMGRGNPGSSAGKPKPAACFNDPRSLVLLHTGAGGAAKEGHTRDGPGAAYKLI